jgi:hypothetical protein
MISTEILEKFRELQGLNRSRKDRDDGIAPTGLGDQKNDLLPTAEAVG